jgi:hypothetical protein
MLPGVRVSRKTGAPLTHAAPRGTPGWKRKGEIHPRVGTTGGRFARGARRPSLEDAPKLVAELLGQRRVRTLQASLTKRGATAQERRARVYLAVLLRYLDDTAANRAAAELLLRASDAKALRKIGDLRRREYDGRAIDQAESELRSALGRLRRRRNSVRPRA